MTDAHELTVALRGHWHTNYGLAACPVCQMENRKDQRALTICNGNNGRLLLHCKKSDCDFFEIIKAIGILVPGSSNYRRPHPTVKQPNVRNNHPPKKSLFAKKLWEDSRSIHGTLADFYLRARGITCDLPESLRFHPRCRHPMGRHFPAMIARISGSECFAIHRTYLDEITSKKSSVSPQKAMLGSTRAGAVRLTQGETGLTIAEGIETGLSLASGLTDATASIWACLSTSGLRNLKLPPHPSDLLIACDGDKAGRAAAQSLAERANYAGWTVSIADPGDGLDFNDVLRKAGS